MIQKKICCYLKKNIKGWTILNNYGFHGKNIKFVSFMLFLVFFKYFSDSFIFLKQSDHLPLFLHVFVWERSILVCVVYDDLIYKCNLMLICNGSKTINYIKKTNQLNIKVRTCTYCLNMDNFFKFLHCRVKVKISLIWLFNSFCIWQYLVDQYNGSFTSGWDFKVMLQTNLITKMIKWGDSLTPQLGCWWC